MAGKGSGDRKTRESLSEAHCPGCRGVREGSANSRHGPCGWAVLGQLHPAGCDAHTLTPRRV